MPPLPEQVASKRLHDRAEECRALAETFRHDETRQKMLAAAAHFEQMAHAAEHIEAERYGPL